MSSFMQGLVAGLVTYAVTPVDFVPDVIPIFGFIGAAAAGLLWL